MGSRRRDSGHTNKLYDDGSSWEVVVVLGVVTLVVVFVLFVIWMNMDGTPLG